MFLLSQKNSLYNAIKEHGFSRQQFKLVEPTKASIRLAHEPTGFYFLVNVSTVQLSGTTNKVLRLYTYSTPKRDKLVLATDEQTVHGPIDDWQTIIPILNQWLGWLKAETEQPDLWAEMEHEPYLFDDAEVVTDEPFTQGEIKLLEARVLEVEKQIIDLNLPPDAQAAITAIVRKVPVKATRFTKKELSDSLVGSFVKTGFKWQLTTADISDVWLVSQHFFTLALP